jgi:transcriptional regulator with XRE-family HTH domain
MKTHPIMEEMRAEREARGITQAELGKRAGYHPNCIGEFERGTRRGFVFSLYALSNMANALGLEIKIDRKS